MKLKKAAFIAAGVFVAGYVLKYGVRVMRVNLKYFVQTDFGAWFPLMSLKLIESIDLAAYKLSREYGYEFIVSRIGSEVTKGKGGFNSQHNVLRWAEVRAIDVNVLLNGHKLNPDELLVLFERVKALKLFSGIGVYPFWNRPGLHLDVRENRTTENPAQWGDISHNGKNHAYKGVAYSIDFAKGVLA